MNLSSLLNTFATGTYTVTRTARGDTVKGRVQAGTTSTVSISASVSPAPGEEIQRLLGGRTDSKVYQLFTTTELYAGGEGEDYEADSLSINSGTYEISHVEPWGDPESGSTMYRCLAVEQ